METIEVNSGNVNSGDTLKIVFNYSGEVEKEDNSKDNVFTIKIGEEEITLVGTIIGNSVVYEKEITDADKGKLTIVNFDENIRGLNSTSYNGITKLPVLVGADEVSDTKVQSVIINDGRNGDLKTGDTIKVEVTYNKPPKIAVGTKTTINIKVGERGMTLEGTISGTKVTYSAKIGTNLNGEVKIEELDNNLVDANDVAVDNEGFTVKEKVTINKLEWTDISNAKLEVYDSDNSGIVSGFLKITGVKSLDKHTYYIIITDTKEEPNIIENGVGKIDNYVSTNDLTKGVDVNTYLEEKGDHYVWVIEEQQSHEVLNKSFAHKTLIAGQKLGTLKMPPLSQRLPISITNGELSIRNNLPHGNNVERKYIVKIGKVTDEAIINKIKNKDASGYESLLLSAKTAEALYTEEILTKTKELKVGERNKFDEKGFKFEKGTYYFIYTVIDDENGIYVPAEDVGLYMGLSDYSLENLNDTSEWNGNPTDPNPSNNNSGNNNNNSSTYNTQSIDRTTAPGKIPQTGQAFIAIFAAIILGITTNIGRKKYKEIKNIK